MLGFYGCDEEVGESILSGNEDLIFRDNDYDWLGNGAYFWEQNPKRALEFACEIKKYKRKDKKPIKTPFVIGAIINLGKCLNLMESDSLKEVKEAYDILCTIQETIPENKRLGKSQSKDLIYRYRDCAVMKVLHALRDAKEKPKYDTVRAAFIEGDPLYEGAGFNEKNHIQICVVQPTCIKGFFRLPKWNSSGI